MTLKSHKLYTMVPTPATSEGFVRTPVKIHTTVANINYSNKDHMAYIAKNIYSLALDRKNLLTTILGA